MKKLLLVFILLNSLVFAKINDTLSLFSPEEKEAINTVITKIQENNEVEIYVNTYSDDEGFVIDKNQKVVALNMIKVNDEKMKVELKFSKDMDLDEETKIAIENLLDENEQSIRDKENASYVQGILVGVDALLENIKVEPPIVVEEETPQIDKKNIFIGLGLAFLIIFGIIVRVFNKKGKKRY